VSWTAIVPINLGRERKSRLAERLSASERTRLADAMSEHVLTCLRAAPEVSRLIVLSPQAPAQAGPEPIAHLPLDGGGVAPDFIRGDGGGERTDVEGESPEALSVNSAGLTPSVIALSRADSSPIEGERGVRIDSIGPDFALEWRRDLGRGLNAELAALRDAITGPLLVVHGDLPLLGVEDVSALLAAAQVAGVALAPDRHGLGTNAVALREGADFGFAFGEGSLARHKLAPGAVTVSRTGLACDVDTPADLDAVLAAGWRYL
jgi:2-phospho-L-lactate guanylyltransferase